MNVKLLSFIAAAAVAVAGVAQESVENKNHGNGSAADKPMGFRFLNNRLTIKPYVSISYTYDSNVDTTHHGSDDNIYCINPGFGVDWKGDRWQLVGSLWYRYNAYCDYADELGENSYGENLAYTWSNVSEEGKGWNLLISERYQLISQHDSINSGEGRGIWRDRELITANGVIERRFSNLWHADLQGQYSWIDYKNDTGRYAPLYGWSQYAVGAEVGYVASRLTDILISGGYSVFNQKQGTGVKHYDNHSEVWTVQAGLGTHATEKITYRALMGVSQIEYGGHGNTDCGWTYSLSANWRITRQLQMSLLGSSYYQPSERSLGSAIKVYSLSGGLSYLTFGDQVNLTANLAWRREQNIYNDAILAYGQDYDEDIISLRLGATYTINRWVSIFGNFTWEENWCGKKYTSYDYDRYRLTIGARFHY